MVYIINILFTFMEHNSTKQGKTLSYLPFGLCLYLISVWNATPRELLFLLFFLFIFVFDLRVRHSQTNTTQHNNNKNRRESNKCSEVACVLLKMLITIVFFFFLNYLFAHFVVRKLSRSDVFCVLSTMHNTYISLLSVTKSRRKI